MSHFEDHRSAAPERESVEAREIGATTEHSGESPEQPTNHLGYKDQPVREFRAQYPDEYLEPSRNTPARIEPFSDPRELATGINPDYESGDPFQKNCADCARCFERSWRGTSEEAAGRSYQVDAERGGLFVPGESSSRTEGWAGEKFSDVYDSNDLQRRLASAGHGSSAIVHTSWERDDGLRFGHAYNVVNHQGEIHVVDPQLGQVFPWNEGTIHPGVSGHYRHSVMVWNAKGDRTW